MTWQWIAGFFEGEGNVNWQEGCKGTKQGKSARIVIGQNDKRPLLAMKCFLENKGFKHILLYQRKARPPKTPNPMWVLGINQREEVVRFLDKIEWMLFEKREKAHAERSLGLTATSDGKPDTE